MKFKFSLFCFAVLFQFVARAQNYTFTQVASCPQPLYSPASFSIGDSVFVIGGVTAHADNNPKPLTSNVWLYNTRTDTWVQKNNFPGTRVYGASAFTINGLGYVVNGWDSSGTGSGPAELWQYNPNTDTWVQKAPFTGSTRYTCAVFTLNNKAYIACGFKPYVNDMFEYDPATNVWVQKASFPGAARQAMVYFTIGGYAYAGMGVTPGNPIGYTQSDWYRFDGTTWVRLGDFPGDPLSSTYNFVVNNEGFVVNGLTETNFYQPGASNKVWKYSPATDTWSLWGLFPDTSIFEGADATVGNCGYMGLGASDWFTYPITPKFWRFGPGNAPYGCNAAITFEMLNNATPNFQAQGNFSAGAQLNWDFGDNTYGTGTSVFHSYAQAGTYNVTLTVVDSADTCSYTTSATVNISNISNCSVSISSTNIDSIFTLVANTSGVGPYTYIWSLTSDSLFSSTYPDPLAILVAGQTYNFCVTVTDGTGCVATACQNVVYTPGNVPCQTYMYIYPDNNIPGLYYVGVMHSGAAAVSYLWDFGDGTTSTDSTGEHNYSTPGFYTVCLSITDANNCTSTYCDSMFYIYKVGGGPMMRLQQATHLPTSINNINNNIAVHVYPNPATSQIQIQADGQRLQGAVIYNINGQKVAYAETLDENRMDISSLAPGIYFIDVKVNGLTAKARFIKVE